ncbi:ClpP/crotonase [Trichodelitschia bisporula]|uniref:ClpP/crotonase n=1 Tax=Trichodelitschia bisporula TaxID=703511 RepID=A0A6G1HR73_9PEZI|nr:ClpP/crotonase [Trichodelitschia bisporula]
MSDEITLETRGKIAIITLNREKKLNALNLDLYYRLATLMNEVAAKPEIAITILTGKGRFFSAGADVGLSSSAPTEGEDIRRHWLRSFVSNNLFITHAFYSHPKILVVALNGPAVGLSAALVGFADFVYAAPHTFILTPFTSLGLVSEGGASIGFVQRLGIAKANEALIQSKRISAEELVQVGFVNKIFDTGKDSDKFLAAVLAEVDDRMGDHLDSDSMMKVKALIQAPGRKALDAQGVLEVFGGLDRFVAGIPQGHFAAIAAGTKKHKL